MNETKLQAALLRQRMAGARAIGLLESVATWETISPFGIVTAREIAAEWNAAAADIDAALVDDGPTTIQRAMESQEAALRG